MQRISVAFGLAAFTMACGGPALSQNPSEVQALKKQVQELQESQKAMRKDLDDLKRLIRGPQPKEDAVVSIQGAPAMGDSKAKVTVVEFSDYQCPFCARHNSQTLPQLVSDYVKTGKIKYVLRDFPLENMHPQALKAAQAARCAGDQGKYWEMHDKLVSNQRSLDARTFESYAKGLSMDVGSFNKCVESNKYAEKVRLDLKDGQEAGVNGTPTFFVGYTDGNSDVKATATLVGAQPFAKFKETIDGLLAKKK